MSLTKQLLRDKIKPSFQWVEIEGFGTIGIRSVPYLQAAIREAGYVDPKTGQIIAEEIAKKGIHELIDRVMVDKETPMFTDEDEGWLASGDTLKMAPLFAAIDAVDGDSKKKVQEESSDT